MARLSQVNQSNAVNPKQIAARDRAFWAREQLRHKPTPAELEMRAKLKEWGIQHAYQWVVSSKEQCYVADFLIEHRGRYVVLELDGGYHFADQETIEKDRLRDRAITQQGFGIVHFRNREVSSIDKARLLHLLDRARYWPGARSPRFGKSMWAKRFDDN